MICPFIQKFLYGIKAQSLLFVHVPRHLSFPTNNKQAITVKRYNNFYQLITSSKTPWEHELIVQHYSFTTQHNKNQFSRSLRMAAKDRYYRIT